METLALSMIHKLRLPIWGILYRSNGPGCETLIQCDSEIVIVKLVQRFHSVTQSSFDNPCTPLDGGFNSGVTGNPPETLILPEWNLTITDDTQRTWSLETYIAQEVDSSTCSHLFLLHGHCPSFTLYRWHGWVRYISCLQKQHLTPYTSGINVPLTGVNHSFNNFSENAKALKNPPVVRTC